MTDDELIARHMGGEFENGYWIMPDGNNYKTSELDYHKSWDRLMPVVDKISEFSYESHKIEWPDGSTITEDDRAYMRTFGMRSDETGEIMVRINRQPLFTADSLIKATCMACVDFIKWYNEQK